MKPYYEHGGITIYHGDCREILPTLGRFDLCLTDPPYGIGAVKHGTIGASNRGLVTDYGKSDWDNSPPEDWVFGLILSKADKAIIWGGNFFPLPPSSCWLVWDKDNTGNFADCELAWTNLDRAVRKIRYRWNGMLQEHMGRDKEPRLHPTQKPLEVMSWAFGMCSNPLTTVDPFMGSGTVLRVAKDYGLQATGIEIEEKYCEIAAKRLAQEVLNFQEVTSPEGPEVER